MAEEGQSNLRGTARALVRTIGSAYKDQAQYFLTLPDDAWSGPTGCARWTMHDLAGHIVGEAVWFTNLVRGIVDGAPDLPDNVWEKLNGLPGVVDAYAMIGAVELLGQAVDRATDEQLQRPVDMGFTHLPLWRALCINLLEAVLHNWDGRAKREVGATIPVEWAQHLAAFSTDFVPFLAHRDKAADAAGRYLLIVRDGVGPMSITIQGDEIAVERGQDGAPDATLHLTADQYVRLLSGRLPLRSALEGGEVTGEGDARRAEGLNRVFSGIAN